MFERPLLHSLLERLSEPRQKIQILSGARQVGKTTLSLQALKKINSPHLYAIAESGFNVNWIDQQWAMARALLHDHPQGVILIIDEVQKIENWSERVKRLWDEDTAQLRFLKVVLLGSSSLLLHRGLTESMAGRYEIISVPHWSFLECQTAFGVTFDEFIYFGSYPGSLTYIRDEDRFLSYIQESIIEPVVTRDILSQFIVHKPALLRELFRLGCEYSGQILSFNKMIGQMQDAGNTTTLAHYLTLLAQAGVLKGLDKFAAGRMRQRQSSPKLQVYNTSLMTAVMKVGFTQALQNPELKGRLIESAIGAHLLMNSKHEVYYWRENNKEVDFIVQAKGKTIAIEVKSGKKITALPGIESFSKNFPLDGQLLVGTGGIPFEMFLKTPLDHFY
jgi:predicted AAA+ superfamily ATPase